MEMMSPSFRTGLDNVRQRTPTKATTKQISSGKPMSMLCDIFLSASIDSSQDKGVWSNYKVGTYCGPCEMSSQQIFIERRVSWQRDCHRTGVGRTVGLLDRKMLPRLPVLKAVPEKW